MDYDFLQIYYPQDSELDSARKLAMRAAASLLIRRVYPDVDTAPNSPFGDLFVSPAAPAMTAEEQAFNRLLSDMDPENVEGGTVFNCDWTRQFQLNFGIQDDSTQRSYGILRLYFDSNEIRELDQSTEFQVGTGIYRPFAPFPGAIRLLASIDDYEPASNDKLYSFHSEDTWVVDVLAFGSAGQLADAGASVSVDRTIEGLTAAVALSAFLGGTTPTRLQELARRVRYNFHTRTPSTRGGATNLIHQQFPEITSTGCLISGDAEQMRDAGNILQVAAGKVDILVRSPELLTDTVTVRLRQTSTPTGLVYSGWMDLPETPIKLVSFENAGEFFEPDIYSVSTDTKCPALTAAYGAAERLFISIPYSTGSAGDPDVSPGVDGDGVYADFTVVYLFDPALKVCQEFLRSDANMPAGLDIYVRWFTPVEIRLLEVDYNRKAGTSFNLTAAREEIDKAYNSHRYETPAGPALIDAALYYNGAHSVNAVYLAADVRYSVARYVWVGDTAVEPTDPESWTTFLAGFEEVPELGIFSAYEPDFSFIDTEGNTLASSGPRSVSYLLASADLRLIERRSI